VPDALDQAGAIGIACASAPASRRRAGGIAVPELAERPGYSSASTFSVSFSRHIGVPPMQFARQQARLQAD